RLLGAVLQSMNLSQFDGSASLFEGLLGVFSVFFLGLLQDGLRSTVNQSLGFAKTEAGDVLNSLDNSYLLSAGVLQNDVVFALLLGSSAASFTAGSRSGYSHSGSSRLDAVFILQDVLEFVYFEDSQAGQLFCQFLQIFSHVNSP